jgi:2',3'-cyclic-nucleotide 2'-phosphodiesterase (5'-nucleotidase family)
MRTIFRWRRGVVAVAAILSVALGSGCGSEGGKKRAQAKPDELTVVFSSDLLGKVRSCGCVIEDMGGLGRWATFTGRVRESVDNLIVVDAGDVFGAELSFTQKEAELAFDAMNVVGLDAYAPGETDFVFGLPFLRTMASRAKFAIVAANVVDPATGELVFGAPYTIKTLKGGLRVGIVGVLDDAIRFPSYIDVSTFKVLPAIETVRNLVPELKEKADFLVILSHMGMERSLELARQAGDFDLVVVGHAKPVLKELTKQGESIMLATGGSGQYMGRIDLSLAADGAIEQGQMKLVPLDDSIPLNQEVTDLFVQYGVPLTDKEMHKKK